MKTYNKLYKILCSEKSIYQAYEKAKKGKTNTSSVKEFDRNFEFELLKLRNELISKTYFPRPLKRFIVRDPKTRTIHASAFRDRIVHHAIVNLLDPIYEKIFICDSFASRKDKGTNLAVKRFDDFKRKVSSNGRLVKNAHDNNSIKGYVYKADIKKYFDTVDHEVLINLLHKKIDDSDFINLVRKVLNNFDGEHKGKGMPLGNYTSQFFANVYLNKLDYFVKHNLKAKYYIRYVDDFVVLHKSRKRLEYFERMIKNYLKFLKLEVHPDKSKIEPFKKGTQFLGYRIFYHHRLLRKRNLRKFRKRFEGQIKLLSDNVINKEQLLESLQGWFGYSQWANTYGLREGITRTIIDKSQ